MAQGRTTVWRSDRSGWRTGCFLAVVVILFCQRQAIAAPAAPCRFVSPKHDFCGAVEIQSGFVSLISSQTQVRKPLEPVQADLIRFTANILHKQQLYKYLFKLSTVSLSQLPGSAPPVKVPADGSQLSFVFADASDAAWKIEPAIGSINAAGLYSAPKSAEPGQKIVVTATSKADATKSATGTIVLVAIPDWVRDLPGAHQPPQSLPDALHLLQTKWPACGDLDCANLLADFSAAIIDPVNAPFIKAASGDPTDSFISFQVEPLLTNIKDVRIAFDLGAPEFAADGRLLTGAQVRQWLARNYLNRFWIKGEIEQHFEELYRDIGLNPSVFVSKTTELPPSVHISESSRIARIIFPNDGSDPDTRKIAYLLLDTEAFSRYSAEKLHQLNPPAKGFVLCLPEVLPPTGTDHDRQACDPVSHLPTGDQQPSLPYQDNLQLQSQQAALQAVGYSVTTLKEPTNELPDSQFRAPTIDLLVQKAAPAAGTTNNTGTAANGTTNLTAGQADPASRLNVGHQQRQQTQTSIAAEPSVANHPVVPAEPNTAPAASASQYQFGAQFQYRPGQGSRALGVLQSKDFHLGSANGSFTGQVGSDGTHAIGGGDLNLDFIWFLDRRLTFHLNGSSDVTAQRVFGGVIADERRTGGGAYAELELFRDVRGFRMGFTLEPQHETVALSLHGGSQAEFHLTTAEPGLSLAYTSRAALHPTTLHVTPRMKFGLGLAANEPTYRVFSVEGGLHQRVSNAALVSFDMVGRFQAASATTPIFELPSLGGEESLRGFRSDDALGRTLWSLQSELWVPVPGTLRATSGKGVLGFLRQQIRLAAFFDAGGVADTDLSNTPGAAAVLAQASAEGVRKGPGFGVRFLKGPIALKLDWAYGIGDGASGPGRGRFYIGVSTSAF